MKRDKYVGMDVHQSMTVVAVMNAEGKIVLETMVPTAASRIRELIESLSGPLHVTLEEGPQAGWLHEVIRDLVKEVVVCDPKRNKLLSEGSKGDKPDARRLADLLRVGMVRSVWHGHARTRGLKQMVRAYETFTIDTKRTMLRIGPRVREGRCTDIRRCESPIRNQGSRRGQSSPRTSGKWPYRARWASPHKRVGIRRSPEYREGKSQRMQTRTYQLQDISAKCTHFAIRFAEL